MAPVQKRRRGEEDVRQPKKKKVHVKKQKHYHSSSDEDSDDDTPRASDAPARRPAQPVQPAPEPAKPKGILKQAPQAAADEQGSDEEELDDDEELSKNTGLNTIPAEESDADEDMEEEATAKPLGSGDEDEDDNDDYDSDSDAASATSGTSANAIKINKKRNDPSAFATSISKILDTKLSTTKRVDPVLSRSKSAADANKSLADSKLEQKARAQIRHERRTALDKGRVKDVLGLQSDAVDTGKILEQEKRLKKTAQRGVVKLFNAVRAAQVKAEEATRQSRSEGVVGMKQREERVNDMSKQGFLDLISSGGKPTAAA